MPDTRATRSPRWGRPCCLQLAERGRADGRRASRGTLPRAGFRAARADVAQDAGTYRGELHTRSAGTCPRSDSGSNSPRSIRSLPPNKIARLCREAAQQHVAAVSVNSRFVSRAAELLENTGVGVCASAAFPFRAMSSEAKIGEARSAVWDGATEIDMVLSIGLLKGRRYQGVFADIRYVRQAVEGNPGAAHLPRSQLLWVTAMVAVAQGRRDTLTVVVPGSDPEQPESRVEERMRASLLSESRRSVTKVLWE